MRDEKKKKVEQASIKRKKRGKEVNISRRKDYSNNNHFFFN